MSKTPLWDGLDKDLISAGYRDEPNAVDHLAKTKAILGRVSTPDDLVGATTFLGVVPLRLHHRPESHGRWRGAVDLSRSILMSVAQTFAPPTAELLIARARAMVPHIAACARKRGRRAAFPNRIIAQIAEAGLFRILQPARWGGYEMKPETYYDVLIALAEGDMSVGWVYGVLGVHPWLMGLMDERAVRDVWGDDDSVRLCSSLMPVGKAEKVDGGFRVSGHWRFSSGCHLRPMGSARRHRARRRQRRSARRQLVHGAATEYRIDDDLACVRPVRDRQR